MLEGISIKQVSIYCPERVINNQYFIDHFQKQGIDIKRILKKTGRKNRHVIEGTKENSLTMAINAAQQAIDAASLKSADIDLILFFQLNSGIFITYEFIAYSQSYQR